MAKRPAVRTGLKKNTKPQKAATPTLALSVRQPFAELIMLGKKKVEYRSIRTHKRERVYVYAATKERDNPEEWKKAGCEPGELPTGVLVGTVEIVDCVETDDDFEWKLARPERLARPRKPKGRPQPVFFDPR